MVPAVKPNESSLFPRCRKYKVSEEQFFHYLPLNFPLATFATLLLLRAQQGHTWQTNVNRKSPVNVLA